MCIAKVLRLHPDHPEALRLLAGVLNLRGLHREAIESMYRALSRCPSDALYHNTLGSILIDAGDLDGAITALQCARALRPDLAVAHYNLGLALTRCMRIAEAEIALRQAVALAPMHVEARVLLADALKAKGQVVAATEAYRVVIRDRPDAGAAWWGLADLKTIKLSELDVISIQTALRSSQASHHDRIKMGFALAKALDDQDRLFESFEALKEAHSLARQRQQWDAKKFSSNVDAVLAAFGSRTSMTDNGFGEEVIFIVGMPRSGTTLVEQILSSHSQVEGAGELPDLTMVLEEEARNRGQRFPGYAGDMSVVDWKSLGQRYLERTGHWRARRPRFTDKFPGNWRLIGAIMTMLPAARVVCCRRDPVETCLSCYRQYLAGNEYARTFADLAAYWRDFDRAVCHWRNLYPERVCEIQLENVVAAPEAEIRNLTAFCGLSFEQTCLEFHKSKRDVFSPSAAQVRDPIRCDTARSVRYGSLLDPLRLALGAPRFPD